MKRRLYYNRKILIIFSIIIFTVLQVGLIGLNKYYLTQSYVKEVTNSKPVGEIVKGTEIKQELPTLNKIDYIDFLFATYGNNVTSKIKISIIQKDGKEIFSTIVDGKDVKDNQYYSVPININVENKDGPTYLKIEGLDGKSGNALTIWSSDVKDGEKSCFINNEDFGKTLNIKINESTMYKKNEIIKGISMAVTLVFLGVLMYLGIGFIEKRMKFDEIYRYRYLIISIIFIISVFICKVNFSSLQAYKVFLPNNVKKVEGVQIGDYRGIRSDEWGVLTPLQLSQESNNYNSKSNLLGEDMSVSAISGGIPTKSLSVIGKPFLWGYILFGSDIGFSWYSVSKLFLLLIFSYKLINVLTKDKKLGVIGGTIISFSPGIQWWFTTNAQVTESIICWEMIVVSLYKIFSSTCNKIKYANGFILLISTIGFTLVLYPPFQVPLFYLGIALLIGLYLDNKDEIKFSKGNFGLLAGVIILYLIIIGITVFNMMPEIQKIMNTVYPGMRSVTGGTLKLEYMFNYLPTLLLPFKDITYSNASEISSFITIFPIPLIVYFLERKSYKSNIIKSLVVFIIGTLIFMYIGLPKFIAKITLMSFVVEGRLYVIFGLACTILIICMTKYVLQEENNKINTCVQIVLYVCVGIFVYIKYKDLVGYIGIKLLILIILLFSILTYYFNKNRMVFIKLLLIVTVLSGATINPINFGIEEITQTPFSLTVREINKEDPGMWITIDDTWISKYILAQGVQVLNALNYPPMLKTWEKLDKDGKFTDVYNRYAHVKVYLQENHQKQFELEQADVFKLNISEEQASELGIKYVVTRQKISEDIKNMDLIYTDPLDNILIYKINQN